MMNNRMLKSNLENLEIIFLCHLMLPIVKPPYCFKIILELLHVSLYVLSLQYNVFFSKNIAYKSMIKFHHELLRNAQFKIVQSLNKPSRFVLFIRTELWYLFSKEMANKFNVNDSHILVRNAQFKTMHAVQTHKPSRLILCVNMC